MRDCISFLCIFYLPNILLNNKNLIQPFTTTVKTKPEIIEDLILSFQEKTISIPDNDWLKMELESYTFNYSKVTRKVTYSAPTGLHDDGVMSLAICNHSFNKNKTKGIYVLGY